MLECRSEAALRHTDVLIEALEDATQRLYSAGADRKALSGARADFSGAIKKLKAHKKIHGCDPIFGPKENSKRPRLSPCDMTTRST